MIEISVPAAVARMFPHIPAANWTARTADTFVAPQTSGFVEVAAMVRGQIVACATRDDPGAIAAMADELLATAAERADREEGCFAGAPVLDERTELQDMHMGQPVPGRMHANPKLGCCVWCGEPGAIHATGEAAICAGRYSEHGPKYRGRCGRCQAAKHMAAR